MVGRCLRQVNQQPAVIELPIVINHTPAQTIALQIRQLL